jgi:hypothetical protein
MLSHIRVSEWQKQFLEGREEVEDDEHPGCPSKSKTEETLRKSVKLLT